jgi:UDP-2-acetamido-3-amino-2,3-dideoxy-glucuronate N-acetyltransferase
MEYFVHSSGLCESVSVGKNTRIWAFAHVLPNARIGADCNICDHVFIENDVLVGDRVTIKCGVQLWDGVEVQDDVFIGPNVTFTNDIFPRSKKYPEKFLRTLVMKGASIGANATLLPGISVGANAMIGAGAVVTRSVPSNAIVIGNPARIVGYVDALEPSKAPAPSGHQKNEIMDTEVPGVTLHFLSNVSDIRGSLSVGEFERYIPFTPLRYFLVYDVPTVETRGEHAHFNCKQFLVAVKGSVHVVTDDGHRRQEIVLDSPSTGLYLPPMTWGIQYRYSSDAVLLVFASDYYDPIDYIRNYDQFVEIVKKNATISA